MPDPVWGQAAQHYSEPEPAALVLWIATTIFNRLNATTRHPAGTQSWR